MQPNASDASGPSARHALRRLAAAVLATAASAVLATAQGSPGSVLDQHEIAAGVGGLTGPVRSLDQFGRSVATVGDLDGDGRPELVVGAHGDDTGGTQGPASNVGALYVLFLDESGDVRAERKLHGGPGGDLRGHVTDGDFLGKAVAPLGDFDGDGVPDLAAGVARADDGGLADSGAVLLLLLRPDGSVRDVLRIAEGVGGFGGELAAGDEFGAGLDVLGDVDGDGVVDLAVGAREADDGGVDTGAVFVLFLRADGTARDWQRISRTAGEFDGLLDEGVTFGSAVSGLGDLDGDGVPDLAVGVPWDSDGGPRSGAVWLLFLQPDGKVRDEVKLSAAAGGFVGPLTGTDELGSAIDTLGDLDGDGVVDVAVGAPVADEGGTGRGAVYVLSPAPDGSLRAQQKLGPFDGGLDVGGLDPSPWFGSGVAGLADWNGDGRLDLAVGARFDTVGSPDDGSLHLLALEGVPSPPRLPRFSSLGRRGPAPLSVVFLADTMVDAKLHEWDFGDGGRSASPDPVHTYTAPGTYSVTLTVRDHAGRAARTTGFGYVQVLPPPPHTGAPPTADFTLFPASGTAPLEVRFDDRSFGTILQWSWDFGDGGVSSDRRPRHVYTDPGTYSVALTVTGPGGSSTKTATDAVVVRAR